MSRFAALLVVLVGAINAYPLIGVISAERIQSLYGIWVYDASLLVLLRHRAVLFGLVGAFIIYAAFRPALLPLALIAGAVSMLSFVLIAWTTPAHSAAIGRIALVDVAATAALVVAGFILLRAPRVPSPA